MTWDVAVVGAGAAGLMTAITAAKNGAKVLLLDTREKYGAKIIMSGGTRCNLTNREVSEKDYATNEPNIVRAILRGYTSDQAVHFFNEIGIETAEEPGIGKIFPVADSGQFVLEMLIKEAVRLGLKIETPRRVTGVCPWREAAGTDPQGSDQKGQTLFPGSAKGSVPFRVSGEGFEYQAHKVVLTTGGLSFPSTGSDGTGDTIVQKLGHTILFREPSLTPLTTADEDWKKLTGISLETKMTLLENNKSVKSFQGSFLFTHFGFSGPVVLNISRFWICSKAEKKQMLVSFLPNHTEEQIRKEIVQGHFLFPRQTIKNYLSQKKLPDRFVEALLQKCCINRAVPLCDLIKNERETLIKELFRHELSVIGDKGYAKAEVTAGGVDLREIRKETMESRKVPGLYLAGEILDCDGKIGGFNFQWAWSTGFLAGKAAAAAR